VSPGYLTQTSRARRTGTRQRAPRSRVEHVLHAVRPDARVREYPRITDDDPVCCLRDGRERVFRCDAGVFIFPAIASPAAGTSVMGEAERPVLGSMVSRGTYRPRPREGAARNPFARAKATGTQPAILRRRYRVVPIP
jgi:hypothetical protein